MLTSSNVNLPESFTTYIEQTYYAQVTAQSRLEAVVHDPDFLQNPLKHVALFSDHGILHGRDIAGKINQVIQQINGLLIPRRTSLRLEFMLGYGAMLAYLHDIGMKNFSAFGRMMHPEFAAQLMFTTEFDPWIELLWQENSGNVAWRLINLSVQGSLEQDPKLVLRELLSLSMAHSKSKVPIELLNDRPALQTALKERISTELSYLYLHQRVATLQRKLAQAHVPSERDRLTQELDTATAQLPQNPRPINPDVERHYGSLQQFEQTAFSWLTTADPPVQEMVLDGIDTVRALRCADALRQRGTTFTTSAGYQVFISQETANAIYALQSMDGTQRFLLEGKDPISAGEANIANSTLDPEGNLRIAFTRGAFSSPAATQWAAFSAAVVIQDIQADVIASFRRTLQGQDPQPDGIKPEQEMQILIEGVDDNPDFADLVCQELSQLNPALATRIQAVTSLQYADLDQVNRYFRGVPLQWGMREKLHLLDQLVKSGHKVDHIDLDRAFAETRLIAMKAGEVLMEAGTLAGFVYIPFQAGLMAFAPNDYQMHPLLPWVPLGDVEAIRTTMTQTRVVAEQSVELLMIPKQIYMRSWYRSYAVEEFTHLFAHGSAQPQLPTRRATSLEMDLQRLGRRSRALPLAMHLMKLFPEAEQVKEFMGYLEDVQLAQGEVLFRQGDRPAALYFVEVGQVVALESYQGQERTTQTFESGSLLGEWEFYSQSAYGYTAIAQRTTALHRLSNSALQRMKEVSPAVAGSFTHYLLSLFADHLHQAKQEILTLRQERTETIERLTTVQRGGMA